MCCFSGNVRSVSNTRIFARLLPENRQALVYSMSLDTPEDVAMILPIPVPPGSGEKAVRFISFEKYADVFEDIERTFPRLVPLSFGGIKSRALPAAAKNELEVQKVGSFDASFVPSIKDFSRLDAQFRLPDGVWEKIGNYAKFGFAVFKLRKGNQAVHPMAFAFPTAMPGRIFFPTVHIHDGKVHKTAEFDHTLYAQTASGRAPELLGWEESETLASGAVKLEKTSGLIVGPSHFFRKKMHGRLRNADVII